jgi:peptide/nickel transport system substrate-binding protein
MPRLGGGADRPGWSVDRGEQALSGRFARIIGSPIRAARVTVLIASGALVLGSCGNPQPTVTPLASGPTTSPSSSPGGSPVTSAPAVDYDQLAFGYTYKPSQGLTGGTLTVGDWRGSPEINPLASGSVANRTLFGATMRTLFLVTADGHWKPDLAAAIPKVSDGTVRPDATGGGFEVDLELRPGLLWSDGQPATMSDLESTWRLARATPSANLMQGWEAIDSVRVTDPTHATVHFSAPNSDYLHVLASYFLPAHYTDTVAAGDAASKLYPFSPEIGHAVTIGPFKYTTAAASTVHLIRDPNWRGPSEACDGRACLDELVYRIFPDDKAGMIDAYQKGDIDVALGLSDTDAGSISGDNSTGVAVVEPAWLYEHFDMNQAGLGPGHGHPALKDVVVRRAIAQAIDRQALLTTVEASGLPALPGVDLATCTNAMPTNYWRLPDPACPSFDVAAANAALDSAGYLRGTDGIRVDPASGQPLVFEHCTTSAPYREAGARFLAQALDQIGMKLGLNYVDSRAVLFAPWGQVGADTKCNLARGNYDTAEFNYVLNFNPWTNYYYPYDSSQIPTAENGGAGFNFLRFSDSGVDAAIDRLGTAIDPETQVNAAWDIQDVYLSEAPEIALYQRTEARAISANLRNFILHPGATLGDGADTWNVEDWWLGD